MYCSFASSNSVSLRKCLGVCMILALHLPALPAAAEADVKITIDSKVTDLVPAIEAGEAKLVDAEIRCNRKSVFPMGSHYHTEVTELRVSYHQIVQGNQYVLNTAWEADYDPEWLNDREKAAIERFPVQRTLAACDGEVSALSDPLRSGEFHLNPTTTPDLLHPYKLMGFTETRTVSQYLRNDFSKLADSLPDKAVYSLSITCGEDEIILDRPCIVVILSISQSVTGQPWSSKQQTRLWLCPEMNYLPVKKEQYLENESRRFLDAESTVDAVREIEPGVFYPTVITQLDYRAPAKDETTGRVRSRTQWHFDSVKPRPSYPVEYFRQLTFPKGKEISLMKAGRLVGSITVDMNMTMTGLRNMIEDVRQQQASLGNDGRPAAKASSPQ